MFRALPAVFFFFNDTATTEIYTLSLHDALPILRRGRQHAGKDAHHRRPHSARAAPDGDGAHDLRSEEHTSELQSQSNLVCRLLLEKKKITVYDSVRRYNALSAARVVYLVLISEA